MVVWLLLLGVFYLKIRNYCTAVIIFQEFLDHNYEPYNRVFIIDDTCVRV